MDNYKQNRHFKISIFFHFFVNHHRKLQEQLRQYISYKINVYYSLFINIQFYKKLLCQHLLPLYNILRALYLIKVLVAFFKFICFHIVNLDNSNLNNDFHYERRKNFHLSYKYNLLNLLLFQEYKKSLLYAICNFKT